MKEGAILLIWDRIGDYHLARVKACEEILDVPVYTADLADSDALYKWDSITASKHTVLSTKPVETADTWNRFKAFRKIIQTHRITTVAMPYGRTDYHLFLFYARLKGIRTIVFSESWYARGGVKDFLKSILLKTLGNFFFVSGQRAYTHFAHTYKINPAKIQSGYSVVDNNHFQKRVFTTPKYLLCIARYSEEKNLSFLIRCYAKSSIQKTYTLKIIGEGPLRNTLQKEIDALGLTDQIELTGWVKYTDLPKVYAEAIAFVLPSSFEPWGLVVNEAMSASLPILLSSECGCVPDLLHEGINGWSFSIQNEIELIKHLNSVDQLADKGKDMLGINSKKLIGQFSPKTWAETIKQFMAV